jgi:OmpA-OmpF porin, OOP family
MNKLKLLLTAVLFMCISVANAQLLKKLSKTASEAAERTLDRKVEEKTEQKTGEVIDEVFEAPGKVASGSKGKKSGDVSEDQNYSENYEEVNYPSDVATESGSAMAQGTQDIVKGSTFFPEGNIIFREDFSQDTQGDFPANWETNSGGEVILINGAKALKMYPNGIYLANTGKLPENYAIEFELTTANLDYKGLASSGFFVELVNEKSFDENNSSRRQIRFLALARFFPADKLLVENWGKNVSKIQNSINYKMKTGLMAPSDLQLS